MKTRIFLLLWLASLAIMGRAENIYAIYPVPHEQTALGGQADFTKSVNVVCESGIDQYTKDRAAEVLAAAGLQARFANEPAAGTSTLYLGVNGSGEKADAAATAAKLSRKVFALNKFDRHVLALTNNGGVADVVILGENTDATFYGLASLEQMLDNGTRNLACVAISDYADLKDRGIIEGYYGMPYSEAVTKDLFRFMARYKLNMYMYGAKSDMYHSAKWAEPYPTTLTDEEKANGLMTQQMLRDICDVAHQTKVNFIWAIHPGGAFTNAANTEVLDKIEKKFHLMYDLGVRQFGIFVDDVGVPNDSATLALNAARLTEMQSRIDKRWNVAGAAPADTVKPLQFVPQLYAIGWSNDEGLNDFFGALSETPSKVNIYITGSGIWTVPNSSDLSKTQQYLKRPLSWWWNYPCNDNDKTKLFPMDMYSNFHDMSKVYSASTLPSTLSNGITILSNPMQQGEVSKIAFFSLADYCWNTAAFDNKASWQAAFPAVVGKDKAAAYKRLAEYLRYYDGDALGKLVADYKRSFNADKPQSAALKAELTQVLADISTMQTLSRSDSESDRLLYEDMAPWLLKLKSMAEITIGMLDVADMNNADAAKWSAYVAQLQKVDALETDDAFQFRYLDGLGASITTGTLTAQPAQEVLRPFCSWLAQNALGVNFFRK